MSGAHELHKRGDDFVIDAVRATQKDGWSDAGDDEAVASRSRSCVGGRLNEVVGTTYVHVETTYPPENMDSAEMMVAVATDRHGALLIKGLFLQSQYVGDIDH